MSDISRQNIDSLLATLDVQLHAFSICEIGAGARLLVQPSPDVVVHYVLSGEGTFQSGEGPPTSFEPDSILIAQIRQPQTITAGARPDRDLRAEEYCATLPNGMVHFDATSGGPVGVQMMCATISATYAGTLGLFDTYSGAVVKNLHGAPAVRAVMEMLATERSTPGPATRVVAESLMRLALVLLVRNSIQSGQANAAFFAAQKDPRLTNALSLILSDPGADLSVTNLASAAGMSRSVFAKAFQEAFGQPPMEFVRKIRLKEGARLLRSGDLPIKVIAARMGFASRSHFSRAFRGEHGIDPSAYRQQH